METTEAGGWAVGCAGEIGAAGLLACIGAGSAAGAAFLSEFGMGLCAMVGGGLAGFTERGVDGEVAADAARDCQLELVHAGCEFGLHP